jgi:hypothetical protein
MADIFFLLAGVVLFFKKEVRISSKRSLSGRPVKILAVLYVLPFVVGFVAGGFVQAGVITFEVAANISLPFVIIAILATLYLIFFHKDKSPISTV